MNTGLKITAFAAAVAATFGTAYGVGKGVGPVTDRTPAAQHGHGEEEGAGHGGEKTAPGGLQISERGYTLDLKTSRVDADREEELRFAVVKDSTGRNVTAYQREHDKELHLIVASRDLTTYRHLHPARAADGTWSTPVDLPEAGGYRVFADFRPEGAKEALTLGADLAVAGKSAPKELPAHSTTAKVDGYDVTLKGELKTGAGGDLTLDVAKNGKPVTDLQPYLGAYGHLVALRSGDLAYLHVHPNGEPGDGTTKAGPGISFTTTAPSKGAYRLFLDFKHEGKVRTAAFTVHAGGAGHAEKGGAGHAEKDGAGHAEKGGGHQH
ncbi:hypothetical protein [Streptomyces alboniger]|uniref:hypothetical protein n=1 Tax=Streptomyces alboniger TaxID=132473 RepID=UPI0006E21B01|nr:hypothetical protein [Streptomyces alboniger]